MKSFNHNLAIPLSAALAIAVAMSGFNWSNDFKSLPNLTTYATEQPAQGAPQWRQTSGPEGAAISALLINDLNLFAGTSNGVVFRSTNQGASWAAIKNGLPAQSVQSLATIGTNIFAGTDGAGVFRLINQGDNQGEKWTAVNMGLTNLFVNALIVSGTNLFAGTRGGVFRSSDQGAMWTSVNTGLRSNANIFSLASVGTNIFAGLPALTPGGGLFRSTNQGESWTPASTGLSNFGVMKIAAIGTTLFAGTDAGVFRSTNQGEGWAMVNTRLPLNTRVTSFAVAGTTIFAGAYDPISGGGAVIRSTDQGENWTVVNTGLTDTAVNALATSGANLFAGTLAGGVFRSNLGENWTAVNGGLIGAVIPELIVIGTNIFAGSSSGSGVFRSSDQGESWTAVNNGLPPRMAISSFASVGTNLYAGTGALILGNGVFRSINQGESWAAVNTGLPANSLISSFAVSGANIFAGKAGLSGGGIYRSTNQGGNWMAVNTGLPSNASISALAAVGTNLFTALSNIVIGPSEGAAVFRSVNQGESWTAVGVDSPPKGIISSFAAHGTNLLAGTVNNGVFRSSDQGESWTPINIGLPANARVSSLAASGASLFVGTWDSGVFLSTNQGESWTAVNGGLTDLRIGALATVGNTLFAGTLGSGVFISNLPSSAASSVSAASFNGADLAVESVVAAFGDGLAVREETARTVPLPISLAGTSVIVKDIAGIERPAPLFYVSSKQVNYQIPAETALGPASLTITSDSGKVSVGSALISLVAPGLFAANGDGKGVAAAVALRIKADDSQNLEPVAQFDPAQNRFTPLPIDLGPDLGAASDRVFLILFGTGIQFRSSLAAVSARIGAVDTPALYAGAQGGFIGLDQVNLPLSRSLAGSGDVMVSLTVDGRAANIVKINIR